MNLQIKNKKSVSEALESFCEEEMLEGDNAYFCEKCDKKVSTITRVCIKSLPRYLIMVLKRFELDYNTMTKAKVNDYCEFPTDLNMEPYTLEGRFYSDLEKEKEKARKEGKEFEEPKKKPEQHPTEFYNYRLRGILIHMGTADSGHYYSFIQDRENREGKDKWYEFNDTYVGPFNTEDIPREAFGGEEKSTYYHYTSQYGNRNIEKMTEKIKNAYLLVYDRCMEVVDEEEEDEDELLTTESVESAHIPKTTQISTTPVESGVGGELGELGEREGESREMDITPAPPATTTTTTTQEEMGEVESSSSPTPMSPKEEVAVTEGEGAITQEVITDGAIKVTADEVNPQQLPRSSTKPLKHIPHCGEPKIADYLHNYLIRDNKKYWQNAYMFGREYFEFVMELVTTWNPSENAFSMYNTKNNDYHLCGCPSIDFHKLRNKNIKRFELQREELVPVKWTEEELKEVENVDESVFKYCCLVFLTSVLRYKSREQLIPCLMDTIKVYINKSSKSAQWILWSLSAHNNIIEFLFECPMAEMRYFVVGIIYCAMLKLYPSEKGKLLSGESCTFTQFINSCLDILQQARKYTKHMSNFLHIFSRFSSLGTEARQYLLTKKALNLLLAFFNSQTNNWFKLPYLSLKTSELGSQVIIQEKYSSYIDEYWAKRKEKDIINANPDFSYIIESISYLLRSCAISETSSHRSRTQIEPFDHHLPQNIMDFISGDIFLKLAIDSSASKVASRALGRLFEHLCHNSKNWSVKVINALLAAADKYDYNFITHIHRILTRIILIKDQTSNRLEYTLSNLLKNIKTNNLQYYKYMEASIDYILKVLKYYIYIYI